MGMAMQYVCERDFLNGTHHDISQEQSQASCDEEKKKRYPKKFLQGDHPIAQKCTPTMIQSIRFVK
jgi:hypothetical protein